MMSPRRGDHKSFGQPSDKPEKESTKEKDGKRQPVTVEVLDNYAAQKWEVCMDLHPMLVSKASLTLIHANELTLYQ